MSSSFNISSSEFFTDDIDGKSLIARMGGASDFDFVVMEMSEKIQSDKGLSSLYKSLGKQGISSLLRKFLTLIFGSNEEDATQDDEDSKKQRILLLHYGLFQNGMTEKHFDRLVLLLKESLETAWVDSKLIDEFTSTMKNYRPLFEFKQRQRLDLASYDEVADMVKAKSKRRSSKKMAIKRVEEVERTPSGELSMGDTAKPQKRSSWLLGRRN